jgi:hypothetical protein
MSAIVKQKSSSHWYTSEGDPMHEVANKSGGGLRSTTIADARKLGLLPSVTTILGILAKPALDVWKIEQAILASLTLPKKDDEPLHEYAKRISEDMGEQARDAASIGTNIHKAIEDWIKGTQHNKELQSYVDAFIQVLSVMGAVVLESEIRVVNGDYAGTIDLVLRGAEGEIIIADIKTQGVKNDKFAFYDEWLYQLSAYGEAYKAKHKLDSVRLANIVLDKNKPGKFEIKLWNQLEAKQGYEVFSSCKFIWQAQKKYNPGVNL